MGKPVLHGREEYCVRHDPRAFTASGEGWKTSAADEVSSVSTFRLEKTVFEAYNRLVTESPRRFTVRIFIAVFQKASP